MIDLVHHRSEHLPAGIPGLRLSHADTGVRVPTRFGGFGISYTRPVAVSLDRTVVRIRDHVMIARLAVALVLLIALVLGRSR